MLVHQILGCSLAKENRLRRGKRKREEAGRSLAITSLWQGAGREAREHGEPDKRPPREKDAGKDAPCQHACCSPGWGELCESEGTKPWTEMCNFTNLSMLSVLLCCTGGGLGLVLVSVWWTPSLVTLQPLLWLPRHPAYSPHTTERSAACQQGQRQEQAATLPSDDFPQARLPTQPESKGCEKKRNGDVQVQGRQCEAFQGEICHVFLFSK